MLLQETAARSRRACIRLAGRPASSEVLIKNKYFLHIDNLTSYLFEKYRISLNTMTLKVESPGVYTCQGVPISVTGIAQVKRNY